MSRTRTALLQAACGGDEEALVVLLKECAPAIRNALAGRIPTDVKSLVTVDDILQDTFIEAFLHLPHSFDPDGTASIETYLITIARNRLSDVIRKLRAVRRGGNHRQVGAPDAEDSLLAAYALIGADGSTPSRKFGRKEAVEALQRAIGQLPEPHRTVVQRLEIEYASVTDVAAALGKRVGAVLMIRDRARKMLRRELGGGSIFVSSG